MGGLGDCADIQSIDYSILTGKSGLERVERLIVHLYNVDTGVKGFIAALPSEDSHVKACGEKLLENCRTEVSASLVIMLANEIL